MGHIFISHAEEDSAIAAALDELLSEAGYSTWHYEKDSKVTISYVEQIVEAVKAAGAFILIISRDAFRSEDVDREVSRAHHYKKPLIPLLYKVSHEEFEEEKPHWGYYLGDTVALPITKDVSGVVAQVVESLKTLGTVPESAPVSVPVWKRVWRKGRRWRLRIAAAVLCALAAAALLWWMLAPAASHVEFIKPSAPFNMRYDGKDDFVYTVHVAVKNSGPAEYPFTDVRVRLETPAAQDSKPYTFTPGVACYDDDKGDIGGNAAQVRNYAVGPLGGTLKLGCLVKVDLAPEDLEMNQKKNSLLREGLTQKLTVEFIGPQDKVLGEVKFCFVPSAAQNTWNTPC